MISNERRGRQLLTDSVAAGLLFLAMGSVYLYDFVTAAPASSTEQLADGSGGTAVDADAPARPSSLFTPATRPQPIRTPVFFGGEQEEEQPGLQSRLDLAVSNVSVAGLNYSPERDVSGTLKAEVANSGPQAIKGPVVVTFFEDVNDNQTADQADTILAQVTLNEAPPPGEKVVIKTEAHGRVLFPKNVVWAWIDSSQTYAESNERNNFANSGTECICSAAAGEFDPIVEWFAEVGNVIMPPAVVDVDANGIPDVIFVTHPQGDLWAIQGNDGSKIWTMNAHLNGEAGIAVGDIDNDQKPEIIASNNSSLLAYEHDGTLKWTSPPIAGGIQWGSAALADLDHDGAPEIVIGGTVLNHDGTLRWQHTDKGGSGIGSNAFGPLSIVADVDGDGEPEIIAGKTVHQADGTVLWNSETPDGFPAIGDFDADGKPEIVLVAGGNVYLLRADGTTIWGPVAIAGGGSGGAPTVADVDGDGELEIGVAGANNYVVLETDGRQLWASPTQDASSNVTGSTVFDFEGDGSVEIVYGDERYLRIYRGTDGKILYERPNPSFTTYELPLVVDVDADGNAEIVAVANYGAKNGICVVGDRGDRWVSTRQIWNQHSYHVTNVYDNGTIPKREKNSWDVHNTYRLNLRPDRNPQACPNLVMMFVPTQPNSSQMQRVTVRVGNAGAIHVPPGVSIAFYGSEPGPDIKPLGVALTQKRMAPGQFEDVSFVLPDGAPVELWGRVDDDGTGRGRIQESDERDNLGRGKP